MVLQPQSSEWKHGRRGGLPHSQRATDVGARTQIHNSLPPGIELVSAENFDEWTLDIRVLDDNPLYRGHIYRLKFKFGATYPIGMSLCIRLMRMEDT